MTGTVAGLVGGAVALVAAAAEPTSPPTQAPSGGFEPWEVSPGLIGFVPVFLIALACVGLFLSLTKQMRRVAVRQARRDAEDAAALAADPSAGAVPPSGPGPADGPGPAAGPGSGPDGAGTGDGTGNGTRPRGPAGPR